MNATDGQMRKCMGLLCVAGCLGMLVLCGCIPKRVVWAPDGQLAAVLGGSDASALYLCDEKGALSPPLVPNVVMVEWLPDSRGMALVRVQAASTWKELDGLLSSERKQELTGLAEELLKSAGTPAQWTAAVGKLLAEGRIAPAEGKALALYLMLRHADTIPGDLRKIWGTLGNAEVFLLQAAQRTNQTVTLGKVLAATLEPIGDIRVSPRGHAVAFTSGENSRSSLHVVPYDGSLPARRVERNTSAYPDWSPDGRALVYAVLDGGIPADGANDLALGSISRQEVIDETGLLITSRTMGRTRLASIVMNGMVKVRCLRDGRVLFAAPEMHFPGAPSDTPKYPSLFALDPNRQETVTRLIPRAAEAELSEWLMLFEVSPDEKQVAFPSRDGSISRLYLEFGTVHTLSQSICPVSEKVPATLPTWRSPDELCFARLPTSGQASHQAEVVLYSVATTGRVAVISSTWPKDVADSFRPQR